MAQANGMEDDHVTCRICWEPAGQGPGGLQDLLIEPCACAGSQAHIHVHCLVRWEQQGNARCHVCQQRFRHPPAYRAACKRLVTSGALQVQEVRQAAARRSLDPLLHGMRSAAFLCLRAVRACVVRGRQAALLARAAAICHRLAEERHLLDPDIEGTWAASVAAMVCSLLLVELIRKRMPPDPQAERRVRRTLAALLGGGALLATGLWAERRCSNAGGSLRQGAGAAGLWAVGAGLGRLLTAAGLLTNAWVLGESDGRIQVFMLTLQPWKIMDALRATRSSLATEVAAALRGQDGRSLAAVMAAVGAFQARPAATAQLQAVLG